MTHTVRLSQFEAVCKERDELAAKLSRMQEALGIARQELDHWVTDIDERSKIMNFLAQRIEERPEKALGEIRAKVADHAMKRAFSYMRTFEPCHFDIVSMSKEFSDQFRG